MKQLTTLFTILVIVFALTSLSWATLIDRGGGMIYDTDLNITWLQDANYANTTGYDDVLYGYDSNGRITWTDAMVWAQNLVYYDSVRDVYYNDWRLPNTAPVNGIYWDYALSYDASTDRGWNNTLNEMGHLFYTEIGNIGPYNTSGETSPQLFIEGYSLSQGPFINVQSPYYWTGVGGLDDCCGQPAAFVFGFFVGGVQDYAVDGYSDNLLNFDGWAWAVRDGDVTPVPEPATLLLLSSGIAGLIVCKRRFL